MAEAGRSSAFSPSAIRRSVFAQTLQHPTVLYPAAAGVLGGVGALLLTASPLMTATAIAGGGVALASWLVNYLGRREVFANRYLARAHGDLTAKRRAVLESLEVELEAVRSAEGLKQLERFRNKMAAFEDVLARKFGRTELTFGRFLGIAEQVYLSGVDNLHAIALSLKTAATVDESYIEGRLRRLREDPATSPVEEQEVASLEQQLELRRDRLRRVDEWLAMNEQALAQLDLSSVAVAEIKTQGGQAATDMESAMRELADIAARAQEYSIR